MVVLINKISKTKKEGGRNLSIPKYNPPLSLSKENPSGRIHPPFQPSPSLSLMEAALDTGARFNVDDLLNFNFGDGGEENDDENTQKAPYTFPLDTLHPCVEDPDDHQGLALPEFAEEELEWLSNKDAFPAVETCLDILAENPRIVLNHHSPVSVLDNSSSSNGSTITSCCSGGVLVPIRYPMKARSKRRQRRKRSGFSDLPAQQFLSWGQVNAKNKAKQQSEITVKTPSSAKIGRRCTHCLAEKTPQWRAGPMGPKTLCNACGVRYKSGRLVPEYRPASSPTFSNLMHSNSHRKIVEMRKQKQLGGLVVNEPCAYRVG